MRPGQFNNNKNRNRNRNRNTGRPHSGGNNNNGGGNPANRVYDSNGPDVKVRGTAQTVAEKYMQLGRDAQSSGDIVMAESYFQHSEHYYRLWLANQPVGQPIQFARRGNEDEFEEEGGDGGPEGDEDTGAEGQVAAEQVVAQNSEDNNDSGSAPSEGGQQQQRNFRSREYNNNREGGENQPQRDGGQPRESSRERFRSRWGRKDRNNDGTYNRNNAGDERPAEAPAAALPEADTGNWEAPSFLTRPVPAIVSEAEPDVVAAPEAVVERRPRGRKPKVEATGTSGEEVAE
jgi:Domain of unknown function (DUF4167)